MADKLTIDISVEKIDAAIQKIKQLASAVNTVQGTMQGGVGGGVSGLIGNFVGGGGKGGGGLSGAKLAMQSMTAFMSAVKGGSKAGPIGAVIGVLVGAFAAAATAAKHLSEAFARMQLSLASGAGSTATVMALSKQFGISDPAGLGAAIHNASKSGLGSSVANKYGLDFNQIDVGSATDRGQLLIKTIEGLKRTIKEEGLSQATAEARALGAESLLPAAMAPTSQLENIKRMGEASGALTKSLHMFGYAWTDLMERIKGFFITIFTPFLKMATKLMHFTARALALLTGNLAGLVDLEKSLNDLERETRENTNQLRQMNGTYGSQRAGKAMGAFGVGAGTQINRQMMNGAAARFGNYSVSL